MEDGGREHGRKAQEQEHNKKHFLAMRISYSFLTTADEAHSVISVIIEPQLQTAN